MPFSTVRNRILSERLGELQGKSVFEVCQL